MVFTTLQGNVLIAILSNYMVDIDWLVSGIFWNSSCLNLFASH